MQVVWGIISALHESFPQTDKRIFRANPGVPGRQPIYTPQQLQELEWSLLSWMSSFGEDFWYEACGGRVVELPKSLNELEVLFFNYLFLIWLLFNLFFLFFSLCILYS